MILFNSVYLARPAWLGCLPLAWGLCFYWFKAARRSGNIKQLCAPHLLKHLSVGAPMQTQWTWPLLWWGILTLGLIAMAGPSLSKHIEQAYQTPTPRIIVLDLSNNMRTKDLAPSRIARARYKLADLTETLDKAPGGAQTGLVVFSSEPFLVSPLTDDAHTLRALLPALTPDLMPVSGHDIGSALKFAATLLDNAHLKQGQLILVTASEPNSVDSSVAKRLLAQGFQTHVLAVGATSKTAAIAGADTGLGRAITASTTSPVDYAALQALAHAGGGAFAQITASDDDLNQLLTASRSGDPTPHTTKQIPKWQDQGHQLLWCLLPWVALLFRRGWLESVSS